MPNTAWVHGLFLDAKGEPLGNTWIQFEARVDLAPLADKSALVAYENAQGKTDRYGVLPLTEIVGSDATGVPIPWSVVMKIDGKRRERFRFLAPAGTTVDLAEVAHIPVGELDIDVWASYAIRAETAAERAEDVLEDLAYAPYPDPGDPVDAPSFALLFENGLV